MITQLLSWLFVAFVSFLGYFGSRYVDSDAIHQLMAKIFGSAYFLSIAFGALYILTTGYIRGVSLSGRILASFAFIGKWHMPPEGLPHKNLFFYYHRRSREAHVCRNSLIGGSGGRNCQFHDSLNKRYRSNVKICSGDLIRTGINRNAIFATLWDTNARRDRRSHSSEVKR